MEEQYRQTLRRLRGTPGSRHALSKDPAGIIALLERGEIAACELLPSGSNYSFLAAVRHNGAEFLAIYKPRRGEIPLWDFPQGTLYRRECAAYVLAEAIGWSFVPPTVVRGGPLGVGSLQIYVTADPEANYFTFGKERVADMQRIALFDYVANNADRKAGHCLLGDDGRIWAIDHGLTFHVAPKLRTVIWDFMGQPIPERLLADLVALRTRLAPASALARQLSRLLSVPEVQAVSSRIEALTKHPAFPRPSSGRSVPWPPV